MTRALLVTVLVASLVLGSGSLVAQQASGEASEVDAIYAAFRDAYAHLDAGKAAALYAADALYLSAGNAPVRGREPIRQVFAEFFDGVRADGGTLAIDFRVVRRDVSPGLVADVGYYRLAVVREGRPGPPSFGRFVTVLRREGGGTFRFVVDSYTGAEAAEWDASGPTPPR